jgi:hypothetical protein
MTYSHNSYRCPTSIPTVRISDSTITDVRTPAELERWFPLASLEQQILALAA